MGLQQRPRRPELRLTLEYLEAAFYAQGKKAVSLSGDESKHLKQIQSNEEPHVATLTATIKKLGGTPVEAPKVDFGSAFDNRKNFPIHFGT